MPNMAPHGRPSPSPGLAGKTDFHPARGLSISSVAIFLSAVGLALSWGLMAATFVGPVEPFELLVGLFCGVLVAGIVAIVAHPKGEVTSSGTTTAFSIDPFMVLKTAPRWSVALFVIALGLWFVPAAFMPGFWSGGVKIFISRAAIGKWTGGQRFVLALEGMAYAWSLAVALSARVLRAKAGLPWLVP